MTLARENVLVVDDERDILELVKYNLDKEGYRVTVVASGEDALAATRAKMPDLIVLDLMLPGVDGLEVCRRLKSDSKTRGIPIVMLTAKGSEADVVAGLELGASDYVTKPFSPRELVARVRAVLRRTRGVETPLVEILRFDEGRLEIDTVKRAVLRDGEPVDLTPNEYKLLLALARYPGRAYSRFELVNRVQGYDFEGYERTIDVHVKNLRKKIEPDPSKPRFVETVTGVGYRLAKL